MKHLELVRPPEIERQCVPDRECEPLLLALARYVQALDERYPGGPEQMRSEGLAVRANMPTVTPRDDGPTA